MSKSALSFVVFTVISLSRMASQAHAYYMEVDSLSMERFGATRQIVDGNTRYLSQKFTVTNTGDDTLHNAGVVWTYVYSGSFAFEYNTGSHCWEREIDIDGLQGAVHSLEVLTDSPFSAGGAGDYLSLSRDETDLALTGSTSRTLDRDLTLAVTDEIPVFWLGDLMPGESVVYTWYALQSPYISPVTEAAWSFRIQNAFVSECIQAVPLSGSLWFLAFGLLALAGKKKAEKHVGG